MPFYDVISNNTTNASAGTATTHTWAKTIASQETVNITGVYAAARFGTAGGCQLGVLTNQGTTASGGTGATPSPRNQRAAAAQSVWAVTGAAITPGLTLATRMVIGFAATGGMGGWIPIVPSAGIQMLAAAANPVDVEFTSNASQASVTFALSVEFQEGVA